ncbi:Mth938-like domain-containing protein [Elusimicrobiota bacterium]
MALIIDHYSFGQITINGQKYTSDVIISQDSVDPSWRRKNGHELCAADLNEKWKEKPEILVIGTGSDGCVVILQEIRDYLKGQDIELMEQKTQFACQAYNKLIQSGKKVVVALHLTC